MTPPAPRSSRSVYAREWSAASHVTRRTVDLSAYPDLVVMYLGMRWNRPRGILTMLRFARRIARAVRERPDGLLLHERFAFSPRQIGMRQYWRDFESLERWARAPPHREWWVEFLRDAGGTGFWHETYFMRGGMEAIYDAVEAPIGFLRFAPEAHAEGGMFSAAQRLRLRESPDPDDAQR